MENETINKLEKLKEMVEVEIDNRREDLVKTEVYLINNIDAMIHDIELEMEARLEDAFRDERKEEIKEAV